jgi:hypothetical protein
MFDVTTPRLRKRCGAEIRSMFADTEQSAQLVGVPVAGITLTGPKVLSTDVYAA